MSSMFDVLGPVTVGPSSSHTAGAVRIGRICRGILGENVKKAAITFYGSFAETYRGHGTDKAVIGGLLGLDTNDEMVRDSLKLAQFRGLEFEFLTAEDPRLHPNTVLIEAQGAEGRASVMGQSLGGGSIMITRINGRELFARCTLDTLAVFSLDVPGVVAVLSRVLFEAGYNISNMRLNRARRAGSVVSVIETDVPVDADTMAIIQMIDTVETVIQIPKL